MKLPQYFDKLKKPKEYFGTLKVEGSKFIIKAKPNVIQMIKRLFPLSNISTQGLAEFPTNKRSLGDLNWFMMRYPLKIKNKDKYLSLLSDAKDHYIERDRINRAISKDEPAPSFIGHLYDFQKTGLSFLINNRRCLLADEMGLGKTPQALSLLSRVNKFPVVIVVPPHLMYNWQDEIKKFLGEEVKVEIIRGLNPVRNPIEDADIYLIHYLILRGWKDKLLQMDFDAIIFDEIQELRHSTSQKYNSARAIAEGKEYIIGLSGTPIYNYGAEMWNVMNIIEPYCLGDWEFFTREWCGRAGYVFVTDPKKLGQYLIDEGLMLRRRKEEVLVELPPKRRVVNTIDLNKELYVNLVEKSLEISYKIPTLATKEEKRMVGSMTLDAVNNARRASGIAKASHVCDFVRLLLDSDEPCLLFAYHHSVVDIYMRLLNRYNPRCITGREDKEIKHSHIKMFMEGQTNLLIVNLRTTSGLNLQRAKCVIFGELDWSPAVHRQAEDRIHRIGQKDSVLAYYLVAPTASDVKISELLGLKEEQFLGLMHDKEETDKDRMLAQRASNKFMSEILSNLQDEFGEIK